MGGSGACICGQIVLVQPEILCSRHHDVLTQSNVVHFAKPTVLVFEKGLVFVQERGQDLRHSLDVLVNRRVNRGLTHQTCGSPIVVQKTEGLEGYS